MSGRAGLHGSGAGPSATLPARPLTDIEIKIKYPPNHDELRRAFDLQPGTVYAWAGDPDIIYSPSGGSLPRHMLVHEAVHHAQQRAAGGPDTWWGRYIDDPEFRLEQEVEAYRAQWQSVRRLPSGVQVLRHMIASLAGPTYGHLVTVNEARDLILAR